MAKTLNHPFLLACTTLCFALGWPALQANELLPEAPIKAQNVASTALGAATALPAATTASPLSRFNAIDWSQDSPVGADELAPLLASNAELRMAALERFRQEPSGKTKGNLVDFLTAKPLPEIMATAMQWAQQADNASTRAHGYQLLGRLPQQPATYGLVRQALMLEQDPNALGAAIWLFSPPQGPLNPAEVVQVLPRLHELTQHPVANIRSASVQRIAEWDKAQNLVTQDVLRLLSDPDEDVRLAAIGASSIAQLISDPIKHRLMSMMANPKEDPQVRSIIALHMERFALTAQEYATYQAVQRELFGNTDAKNPNPN